ncbi:hypothetical protein Hanom_Chr16g01452471 [Helianthus anomalus]
MSKTHHRYHYNRRHTTDINTIRFVPSVHLHRASLSKTIVFSLSFSKPTFSNQI